MNGQYFARRVAKAMARHGEAMTLKRVGEADLPVRGKRVGGSSDALGNATQQVFKVIIGTDELAASAWASKAPTDGGDGAGDTIIVGGRARNILDVQSRGDGDVVALYELEVAG